MVEQRYDAVREVLEGASVQDTAEAWVPLMKYLTQVELGR